MFEATLPPSTIRRTSPPRLWARHSSKRRARGSYHSPTRMAALLTSRPRRRTAEGRVAFVVGILLATLLGCTERERKRPTKSQLKLRMRVWRSTGRGYTNESRKLR